jgi:hypothetical protein
MGQAPPKRVDRKLLSTKARRGGSRLIHAFRNIKQAALREAIIRLVAELSEPDENGV